MYGNSNQPKGKFLVAKRKKNPLSYFGHFIQLRIGNSMNDYVDKFIKRYRVFSKKKDKLEKYSDILSSTRLLFFLTAAVLTVLAYIYTEKIYGRALLSISFIIFLLLVVLHDKVIKQVNRYRNLAEINQKCIQRIEGNWTTFIDDGQEYVNANHRNTDDLDIFGRASLFQWMNTANTYHGRGFTRNLLENPQKDLESIIQRQNATRELALKLEFCQELQCEGMGKGDFTQNPEKLFEYAEDASRLYSKQWFKYIFYILPAITVTSFVVWYIGRSVSLYMPLTLVVIQLIINVWGSKRVNSILSAVYAYKTKVSVYQCLLELVEKEKFNDAYLSEMKADLFNKNQSSSQQIKSLDKIVGAIGFKYNPIVFFIINSLFFWDFHCVFALEKWKAVSGSSLRKWVYNLGMYEALSGMALISQLNPGWCYPKFDQNKLQVVSKGMGHPLINGEKRVANDLIIENQICIVTGSNMSGKTTLLRTVGINLVLAYAGAPVCAQHFECSIMEVFTSMRIRDDLNTGVSTFYAELLRIKMIIDYSKNQKPMIFLIDEVFRGTNSLDRVAGARNVLASLNQSWAIGLISTHDYELCDFENDKSGRIKNYHFVETYLENKIHFDYQLRPGPCKTSNAKYLMKMIGIEISD